MRNLTIALGAIAIAALSLASGADAASRCKKPEKWNAVEGKCEKPAPKPAVAKVKKPA
jgi:hypothetical protein